MGAVSREMLEAIVTAAACTLQCSDTDVCQSCFETIVILHGLYCSLLLLAALNCDQ